MGSGLHLGRRHSGGRSSDALAATQLLEEDDDLLPHFVKMKRYLGFGPAKWAGGWAGLVGCGGSPSQVSFSPFFGYFLFSIFCFQSLDLSLIFKSVLDSNLNSNLVLQVLNM
jgi:hypothetical protein